MHLCFLIDISLVASEVEEVELSLMHSEIAWFNISVDDAVSVNCPYCSDHLYSQLDDCLDSIALCKAKDVLF